MADNFNLRSFLTENKLTKNAQLLKEGSDYGYDELMDAVEDYCDQDSPQFSELQTAVYNAFNAGQIDTSDFGNDPRAAYKAVEEIAKESGLFDEPNRDMGYDERDDRMEEAVEDLEEFSPYGSMAFSGEKRKENEKAPLSSLEVGDLVYVKGVSHDYVVVKDKKEDGTVGVGHQHNDRISYQDGNKEAEVIKRAYVKETIKEAMTTKEAQHLKKGDIITSGDEIISVSAGAKTPAGKVEVTMKTKSGKTKMSIWGKSTKIGVKEKQTVKENTMTQRDKYLTRLVENALGIGLAEEDNVDYTMGRQDDPNQLPNPAPELTIPEGEDMVEEKPLPKYENIEKLMQEIDKSTDEAAHKYKMEEMKRVADGLEKKTAALEEGDNAEHIDQKKLKQMKKDIMSLRKGIEKMEKLGEKKFTKKETKESKPAESLAEGNFDLRKFLIENKLTRDSQIIN